MIFIRVDLPAPFSPTRPWISPRRSTKSTSLSAATPPNDLEMPCMASGGVIGDTEPIHVPPLSYGQGYRMWRIPSSRPTRSGETCSLQLAAYRREKVSPRGPSGLGRDDGNLCEPAFLAT